LNNLLSKIEKKIVLTCEIVPINPIHIGAEREITLGKVDNPFIKINDQPIIPGSSIKGTLRAYLTRLINSLDINENDNKLNELGLKKTSSDFNETEFQKIINTEKKIDMIKNKLGSVDKLFGISGLASPVFITSAIPLNKIDLNVRAHIKIDINTDRTKKGNLFYVESIPPNEKTKDVKLLFQIIFDVPSDQEIYSDAIQLFNYFEKMITPNHNNPNNDGLELFIGGMRSRGYGYIKIRLIDKKEYGIKDLILGNYS